MILEGLSLNYTESVGHTASLFNLFLRLLHRLHLPPRGSKDHQDLRKMFFRGSDADARFIAAWIGKLILFNVLRPDSESNSCLTKQEDDFLQLNGKPDTWTPTSVGGLNLTETKVLAMKLLGSGAFTQNERFFPALIASADPNSRLSEVADDILKTVLPEISLEDYELVEGLFTMYLGTTSPELRLPARPRLKGKILGLLCKSLIAIKFKMQILQVVKEGLTSTLVAQNSTKQGLEASKLRNQVFNFANWVAQMAAPSDAAIISPILVQDLRNYIEEQGWPVMREDVRGSTTEAASRNYAYESIGILAKASASKLLLDDDLDLLRWLFRSLAADRSGSEVAFSIEQALSSILAAFSGMSTSDFPTCLEDILLFYSTLEPQTHDDSDPSIIRSTRYVAVRFANRCLPYSSTRARFMNLLALSKGSNERNELIEEGKKGLDPYWYRILNPPQLASTYSQGTTNRLDQNSRYEMPDFRTLVDYLFSSEEKARTLGFGYVHAVSLCRTILLHAAIAQSAKAPAIDDDWERNVHALIQNDEEVRNIASHFLSKKHGSLNDSGDTFHRLVEVAFSGFVDGSLGDNLQAGQCLLDMCQLGPQSALEMLLPRVRELRDRIHSNHHGVRVLACHLFGLIASTCGESRSIVHDMLEELLSKSESWISAVGSSVHRVHGSVLALVFWLTRAIARGNTIVTEQIIRQIMHRVLDILKDAKDKEIIEAAVIGIGQLSLFGVLDPGSNVETSQIDSVIGVLQTLSKKGDETAVHSLGYVAMQCRDNGSEQNSLFKIIESLYSLHEIRQPELHFAVGSALSCSAIAWDSKALIGIMDVAVEGTPTTVDRGSSLQTMIDDILESCRQSKPSLRQASVIWLLSVVQFCGHCQEVRARLRKCQVAFKGFLADKDSLVQEAASRGLTLVYEKGDREIKNDLIRDLVGSFTKTESNLAGTVSADTQLFEPGALPTGEGNSVTTYKDIVNLASEVGDPSLVYRFMSLASNSAIWSSRAAFGRFGLSQVLSDSSTDGYLAHNPKLYSALYRYRFDPNANVRAAMNDIWSALVKDSKVTLDTHFDRILEDLCKSILNKEWRTRQASCAALADLIQGRPLSAYESQLTRIWELTFKVCDDIKPSVTIAAMQLAHVLTGILIRSLEAGEQSASKSQGMLQQVLPFLLGPSGLEARASEVQLFSVVTIMDIIKKGKSSIMAPFLPDMICRLLALLSSIEPGEVNTLHLNAERYGLTQQAIDDARLTSVKLSPMMEAIERCLDMLDDRSMKELHIGLLNAVKTVIGLPSKVGASRVLVTLATRHRLLFRPYASEYLKILRRQVLDRNDTISTTAATSCGYLARLVTDQEILKMVDYAKKLYFESEEERHRTVAGEIALGLAKYATDRFNSLASACLPFAFFGSHDSYEPAQELFKAAWDDNVGGSRAVLLYLREIIHLSTEHLESPRWSIKHTAAFTIADTVKATGDELSPVNSDIVWPALQKSLEGKTWKGKEKVLEAFVHFVKVIPWKKQSPDVQTQTKVE